MLVEFGAQLSGAQSLREIEVRYRGQMTTITQLIDAQVALSNTRVRHTNAQADVEIARAALERAIGRLASIISRCEEPPHLAGPRVFEP